MWTAKAIMHFNHPAEKIFDAWLDPELIGSWMFGKKLRDEEVLHIKVDPQVGGKFSFLVLRQGDQIDHIGRYKVIEKPNKLIFTWGIASEGTTSEVEVSFSPTDKGCEVVVLHQLDEQYADYVDKTSQAWEKMMSTLNSIL